MTKAEKQKKIDNLLWDVIHLKQLKRGFYTTAADRRRYEKGLEETYIELSLLGYSGDTP